MVPSDELVGAQTEDECYFLRLRRHGESLLWLTLIWSLVAAHFNVGLFAVRISRAVASIWCTQVLAAAVSA